jgi:hypothetical protein
LGESEKGNLVNSTKAGLGQLFVAVSVDVKQEKMHHQKSEENRVNARMKRLPKARQQFLKPYDYQIQYEETRLRSGLMKWG